MKNFIKNWKKITRYENPLRKYKWLWRSLYLILPEDGCRVDYYKIATSEEEGFVIFDEPTVCETMI